jgi:hypothetical protein
MFRVILTFSALSLVAAACSSQPNGFPAAMEEGARLSQGITRVTFPDPDPGIPAYARVGNVLNQFYHSDGWLAMQFFRHPECVPDDFNLLDLFHFPGEEGPGAFACPLQHSGHYIVEAGAPQGTFPRIYVAQGDAVPFWFVPWAEFQQAMQEGAVTLPDVLAMNPLKGTATRLRETVHPRLDEHLVVTDASGQLEDGRRFDFHVTHVRDETKSIRIRFK